MVFGSKKSPISLLQCGFLGNWFSSNADFLSTEPLYTLMSLTKRQIGTATFQIGTAIFQIGTDGKAFALYQKGIWCVPKNCLLRGRNLFGRRKCRS